MMTGVPAGAKAGARAMTATRFIRIRERFERPLLSRTNHWLLCGEMSGASLRPGTHRHTAVVTHAIRQRDGIPYEVERKVCSACAHVLDERPLRRAAA